MQMRVRPYLAVAVALAVLAAAFLPLGGIASAQEFNVIVTSDELNVRTAPDTSAPIATVLVRGDVVPVYGQVAGEEVFPGNVVWFRTRSGWYIYSGLTRPGAQGGSATNGGMSGRWIEIDRSAQVARAIENGRVVYTALVTVGTPAFPTPVGNFAIQSRVLNETMDSSTVGIPINSPDGYYLTGVLYTQYFNDGYAIHYNYWSPPEAFGNYPGSHGCIGMALADSEFFWSFATIGTPVIIMA